MSKKWAIFNFRQNTHRKLQQKSLLCVIPLKSCRKDLTDYLTNLGVSGSQGFRTRINKADVILNDTRLHSLSEEVRGRITMCPKHRCELTTHYKTYIARRFYWLTTNNYFVGFLHKQNWVASIHMNLLSFIVPWCNIKRCLQFRQNSNLLKLFSHDTIWRIPRKHVAKRGKLWSPEMLLYPRLLKTGSLYNAIQGIWLA